MNKQFSANRFPTDYDGNGWYEIADNPDYVTHNLSADSRFEYAIVGAGFAGLTAAHRLAELKPDARILLIDAQGIAQGSSGRNSGFMIDLPHNLNTSNYASKQQEDLAQIQLNRFGINYACDLAQRYNIGAPVFNPSGKYHGATSERALNHLQQFTKALDQLGEPYEHLSRDALHDITGIDYYIGGLFTPGTTMIQPSSYVRHLAANLPESVTLVEHCPVKDILQEDTHCRLKTAQGEVTADNILLTNNGHLSSFGFYRHHLMHIFLTASMTRQLSTAEQQALGGEAFWGVIPAEPTGSTIRRFGDRIVVRNQITYSPKLHQNLDKIQAQRQFHQQAFNNRFKALSGVSMEYTWGGHLCLSRNNVHVFGQLDKRIYAATCQNGLGAAKGSATGAALAEYICGIQNPVIDYLNNMPKPTRCFPEPFMSLGANAYLYIQQKLAGNDL